MIIKFIRQIVITLGLLAAFICLIVISVTKYSTPEKTNTNNLNNQTIKEGPTIISSFLSAFDQFLAQPNKIPTVYNPLSITSDAAIVKQINDHTSGHQDGNKTNNPVKMANIKKNGSKIDIELSLPKVASTSPQDIFTRIKTALSGNWSRIEK